MRLGSGGPPVMCGWWNPGGWNHTRRLKPGTCPARSAPPTWQGRFCQRSRQPTAWRQFCCRHAAGTQQSAQPHPAPRRPNCWPATTWREIWQNLQGGRQSGRSRYGCETVQKLGGQAARRNGRRAHRSAATWSSARVPFATAVRTLSIRARAMCWICAIRHGRSPAGAPAPAEEGVDEGRSPRLAPSGGLPARLLDGCALRAAGRSPGPAGVDGPEERAAANRRPED
jgi:hypothetical protein